MLMQIDASSLRMQRNIACSRRPVYLQMTELPKFWITERNEDCIGVSTLPVYMPWYQIKKAEQLSQLV